MTTKTKAAAVPTLNRAQIDAILKGDFEDIFSVLGLHELPGGDGLVLRALLPNADTVSVVARGNGRVVANLQKIHADGLFEAVMHNRKSRFAYKLRVQYGDYGEELDDPYAFSSTLENDSLYLYGEGTEQRAYRWMGTQRIQIDDIEGIRFVVWAPAAKRVSVVGEFNHWDGRRHVMRKHPASGIWEIFIPNIAEFAHYKYEILSASGSVLPLRSDPFARSMQHPPDTASRVVGRSSYQWSDGDWMQARGQGDKRHDAVSIYEMHAGSWRRRPEQGNRYLSYLELADELIPYVKELGFTHIQLMPISEYPFDGSWGYQPVGLFAPSIRFGTPDEFRQFVDRCHQNNLGLLIDWVPGHFPTDAHGLGKFDGTCLYEHADVRKGFHPDWNTLIYNYGRGEVISYLLSNAHYWLDEFHVDGLRVDAVASMLYLDYSRKAGEWIPNQYGGRENLEAIELLKKVNATVYQNYPGVMMVAEESTAWPGVSRPTDQGGLGFGFKWNMGWMNDTLKYMEREPIHRQYHHHEMTFGLVYAFNENFILPLSHDEVVHGKRSLIEKMPGDNWQKFANLRAYLAFMWAHPGKKLLFMGGEFAQVREWNHDNELDWDLLKNERHHGVQSLVRDLNRLYVEIPALHQLDCEGSGFEWVQGNSAQESVYAWLRRGFNGASTALVVVNMTPTVRYDYRIGVYEAGYYAERLNTDSSLYGGSNVGNRGGVHAQRTEHDHKPCSVSITLPPLATIVFELAT